MKFLSKRCSNVFFLWQTIGCLALVVCSLSSCTNSAVTPGTETYFPQVRVIVQQNCVSCHSPGGMGLPTMLTTDANIAALAAAIKAATIDPASPRNKRMPQGGELSDADKAIIQKWFDKGGKISD